MRSVLVSIIVVGGFVAATEAVEPACIITNPGAEYADAVRSWQGIPGIERAPGGRLWVVWYTGGDFEGHIDNYALLATSGDDGRTWSPPRVAIQGKPGTRIGDPLPWLDPRGRLWIFYRHLTIDPTTKRATWGGTCAIRTDEPDAAEPKWSEPMVIGEGGILFGKPIVRGEMWLAPFFLQALKSSLGLASGGKETGVIASTDEGATWSWRGGTTIAPELRNFSEATLASRNDGSVWMIIRTKAGLYESASTDDGRTWSVAKPMSQFAGPATRAHVHRLASGAFLLLYHDARKSAKGAYGRERLTAWLSDDEGRTWPHKLVLDDRNRVSYPDAAQAPDGRIFAVYDFGRYVNGQKQITVAIFTEEEVRAGKFAEDSPTRFVVNQALAPTVEASK